MNRIACLSLAALTCAPLAAQGFTSPRGFLTTEGDSFHMWLTAAERRQQQVDAAWLGTPIANIQSIAFRRDGVAPLFGTPTSPAKTITLTVRMGYADFATFGDVFDDNYLGTPTTVVDRRQINTPDWTQLPPQAPAAFDLQVPFAVTWTYDGQEALLWEVEMTDSTAPGPGEQWRSDGQTNPTRVQHGDVVIGQGCLIDTVGLPGRPIQVFMGLRTGITVSRAQLQLDMFPRIGSFSRPVTILLGDRNPSLSAPGLCTNLFTTAQVAVPIGTCSGLCGSRLDLAMDPAFVGAELYLQAGMADLAQPGLPIALSNGSMVRVPAPPPLILARGLMGSTLAAIGRLDLPTLVARFE